jgi:hypothetical protein
MTTMTEFLSQEEIEQCIEQVEDLKKIKDINLMGKKLGLRKFKKTEKSLAREMIVKALEEKKNTEHNIESDSDLESLPDAPDAPVVEPFIAKVEEPLEEMVVTESVTEEMVLPEVEEEKPELVEAEKEKKMDTKNMYSMINEIVKNLKKNEEKMLNKQKDTDKKLKGEEDKNKNLNEEFENLFKKYELTVSENEKLSSSNMKLKEAVRNLMGDL